MTRAIYVIASEAGPVKVGIAGDVRQRLGRLKTSSPYPLSVAYAAETESDVKAVERRAHDILTPNRLAGEWFSSPPHEAVAAVLQAAREVGADLSELEPGTKETKRPPPRHPKAETDRRPFTALDSRMARAGLCLGVRELAEAAGVSPNTVARLERGEDLRPATIAAIRAALEAAGVVFLAENGNGPGVALRKGDA